MHFINDKKLISRCFFELRRTRMHFIAAIFKFGLTAYQCSPPRPFLSTACTPQIELEQIPGNILSGFIPGLATIKIPNNWLTESADMTQSLSLIALSLTTLPTFQFLCDAARQP